MRLSHLLCPSSFSPGLSQSVREAVLREPLEPATLQLELPREVDQVHLEVLELRKQVAELGKHLGIAQHWGAEPSGRKQSPASDAVVLRREVGACQLLLPPASRGSSCRGRPCLFSASSAVCVPWELRWDKRCSEGRAWKWAWLHHFSLFIHLLPLPTSSSAPSP
ncbi:hypothetical protein P7K49_012163 [Saguinus oedipus]|uniref:Uncharacterized protein n=1 Tax=Saguinus oedipus TaxID=9490 RepID=A0ABQ9VTE9_SAGOE|nr:hypothetical protein P7K49_012163 [Saguinus oedipus]